MSQYSERKKKEKKNQSTNQVGDFRCDKGQKCCRGKKVRCFHHLTGDLRCVNKVFFLSQENSQKQWQDEGEKRWRNVSSFNVITFTLETLDYNLARVKRSQKDLKVIDKFHFRCRLACDSNRFYVSAGNILP